MSSNLPFQLRGGSKRGLCTFVIHLLLDPKFMYTMIIIDCLKIIFFFSYWKKPKSDELMPSN